MIIGDTYGARLLRSRCFFFPRLLYMGEQPQQNIIATVFFSSRPLFWNCAGGGLDADDTVPGTGKPANRDPLLLVKRGPHDWVRISRICVGDGTVAYRPRCLAAYY